MLSAKAGMFLLLLSFAFNVAGSCEAKKNGNMQNSNQVGNDSAPVNRQPERGGEDASKEDIKTLAQGQYSSVRDSFIVVARDAATYAGLRRMVSNLPDVEQDFFQSSAVVAAFLGERRTGGYSVRFNRTAEGQLRIEENRPPGDSINAQVITAPFSVIAVPVSSRASLAVDLGSAWRNDVRPYRVTNGDFTMSGGITGRSEKFGIAGSIGVMREGNLATLVFELQSKNGAKERALKDIASGLVRSDKSLTIERMGAGSFVDQPSDALRATGLFTGNENKLSLTFESVPSIVIADGYSGRGNLEAEATRPAPQKKKTSSEDQPQ